MTPIITPGWLFIILCVLLAISGTLSSLSVSLITMSRSKLASLIQRDETSPLAKRLIVIEQDPDGHAAAIKILGILVNLFIGLASIYWISGILALPAPNIGSILIGILIATFITWPVTMLAPIGVANHAGERFIALFSRPVRAAHTVFYPLLFAMRFIDEVIRRLAGTDLQPAEDAISSELLSVVSEGQREGHIDETERDMLEAVVEFRSTLAESVMTPRTEVDALEYTDDLDAVQQFINKHGHSRAPVYKENLDHIVGMLYAKDLLGWIMANGSGQNASFDLNSILRPPSFVPETKTVRELLTQLLTEKVHIAIIIDEYGGTSGLVTIEDIVEEIFGEIQDEYEDPEDDPSGVDINEAATSAEIDARTEIDDANDDLERLGIQIPESDDYDTVAGYINTTLGRIPDQGEQVTQDSMNITILQAEPTRVLRIAVEPISSDVLKN
ncbi:MAG: HlyC/CorC family transporter [Phycisphaerales bacterium]|nr:HlyC/CorC family transporter [Phycisphaerales bacterium]